MNSWLVYNLPSPFVFIPAVFAAASGALVGAVPLLT